MTTIKVDCPKCGGDGHLPQFSHINGGMCYKCDGTGKVEMTVRDDMDETVLDVFPTLYIEHEYNEIPSLKGDDKYYFQEARKKHNETLIKFLSGNEELKESVEYIKQWAKKNNFPNETLLYSASYTSRVLEGALGAVSTRGIGYQADGKMGMLAGGARFFVLPEIGFPDLDKETPLVDSGYDSDNTFIHEAIHFVDLVNQNARELGKPDSEKRKRIAQAKANVFDDYMEAVTGGDLKLYNRDVLDSSLSYHYINYNRVDKVIKAVRKSGKKKMEKGDSKAVAEFVNKRMPHFGSGLSAEYSSYAVSAFERGDYEKGMEHLEKVKLFSGNSLKSSLSRRINTSDIEGVEDKDYETHMYHLEHIPLQIAFKVATEDEDYMTIRSRGGNGELSQRELMEVVAHARDTFRENRTTQSANNTLDEITYYASDDLSYEEMDFIRRSYRVIRGMSDPEEGETYLGTIKKLRETFLGDKKKYGMSNMMVNNILTRMSFEHYFPSKRADAYSLLNSNEFHAELGSSMMMSKTRDEQYTEPMKELKRAFEDFYSWDADKAYEEQEKKAPLMSGIKSFLLDKREDEERYSQEYYQAWEAIKEEYHRPDDNVMGNEHYESYMADMEYLDEKARQETGKSFREIVGDESYKAIQNMVTVTFPKQMLGRDLLDVESMDMTEIRDLSNRLAEALSWWDINEDVMQEFVQSYMYQINDLYKYYNIPNRESIRQSLMQMGIDIEGYQNEGEDDF